MAKVKIGVWEVEEETLERQHATAKRRGKATLLSESEAKAVHFDATRDQLVIELKNGVVLQLPRHLVQGLSAAGSEELAQVRLGPRGASIHWDHLGLDFSLSGLLMGLFGTKSWMAALGQKGGRVTSRAKAAAARKNGSKGGRPAAIAPAQAGVEDSR